MYFFQLASLVAMAPAALAQNYGSGGSSTSSSNAAPVSTASPGNIIVKVGENGLTFDPANITATVGSTIEFHFYPPQHSVAQAAFDKPCAPLSSKGFFSGQVTTNSAGIANSNAFTIKVTDNNPLWFYCAIAQHCQAGMVGVVNAPGGDQTLEMFVAAAKGVAQNVEPTATQGGTLAPASTSSGAPATTSKSAGVVNKKYSGMWNTIAVFGTVLVGAVVGSLLL